MLTYIRTPRILIPHVYEPELYGPDGRERKTARYQLCVQIDPADEEFLPAYVKPRVANAEWYGVPSGTRYIAVGAGQPPVVFGLPAGISRRAYELNIPMDRLIVDQPARIAVSSFTRKAGRGESETWPVLRAVEMLGVKEPGSFDEYVDSMKGYWETKE